MLLSAICEAWHFEGTLAKHSPRSLEWREQKLSRFVAWCADQGVRDVEGVTLPVVHRFLAELPHTLSDFTRNGYARVLKAFLHYCAREDLVPERFAKRIQMPKMPQKVIEVFTPGQIKLLLAASSHEARQDLAHRDRAIIAVLLDTDIRASELCGLTLEHVHFIRWGLATGAAPTYTAWSTATGPRARTNGTYSSIATGDR
jgi:site-specific recombinase XerD